MDGKPEMVNMGMSNSDVAPLSGSCSDLTRLQVIHKSIHRVEGTRRMYDLRIVVLINKGLLSVQLCPPSPQVRVECGIEGPVPSTLGLVKLLPSQYGAYFRPCTGRSRRRSTLCVSSMF